MTLRQSISWGIVGGLGCLLLLFVFSAYHTTGMAMALDVLSWCF